MTTAGLFGCACPQSALGRRLTGATAHVVHCPPADDFAPNLVFYGPGEVLPTGTPGDPAAEYNKTAARACGPLTSGEEHGGATQLAGFIGIYAAGAEPAVQAEAPLLSVEIVAAGTTACACMPAPGCTLF
jgi:hypothetical protein